MANIMLAKWLLLYMHESKAFLWKIKALLFTPRAYAKTIIFGNERNFFKSVNFFLAASSIYIAGATTLQWLDSKSIVFEVFSQDFVVFVRLVFMFLVGCFFNFLAISLILWRTISFNNFLHCSLHASVINMLCHLLLLTVYSIFVHPVSDTAVDLFTAQNDEFSNGCLADKELLTCRLVGGALDFSVRLTLALAYIGVVANDGGQSIQNSVLASMYSYIMIFLGGSLFCLAWSFYAQISLFGAAMNESRLRIAGAVLGISVLLTALTFYFPPIRVGLMGQEASEQTMQNMKAMFPSLGK